MIYYLNKRGKKVEVKITRHAVFAFQQRFKKLFGSDISLIIAEIKLKKLFPFSSRVLKHNVKERLRIKRYGHTLYFRDGNFTYVVHDAVMKTVEISKKGFRELN